MKQADKSADLIPAKTVAEILGVTSSRVHQLVRAGAIKPAQQTVLGNLYSRKAIEAFADQRWAEKGSR